MIMSMSRPPKIIKSLRAGAERFILVILDRGYIKMLSASISVLRSEPMPVIGGLRAVEREQRRKVMERVMKQKFVMQGGKK